MSKISTIDQYLSIRAAESPDQIALIHPRGRLAYRQLEEFTNRCARGLVAAGICSGTRVVLMVKPGPEMLALAFALIRVRAVPVLVDPGMGWKNLGRCLAEAKPQAFIGIPLANLARALMGWGRPTLRQKITTGRLPLLAGLTLRRLAERGEYRGPSNPVPPNDESDRAAAIVFTSGSTGVPKGVVYTHRMFTAQARLLRDSFRIEPGEVDLATFPLFALYDPALRMTTVFPEMDFTRPGSVDPEKIIGAVRTHGVTHMFGSPALLDRVSRYGQSRNVKLTTIKRVLSAGAPVSQEILDRFAGLLPSDALIHTPYGATEALPVTSISHRERAALGGTREGKGVCIGKPLHSVELGIIQVSDQKFDRFSSELLADDETIGEIVVSGDNVSHEYFERPEANDLGKICGEGGKRYHRMGDVGYRDREGRIWFCGRKSQRVTTSLGTLYTVACEGIFNAHPRVFRTALVGVGEAGQQMPVLCVELEKATDNSLRGEIERDLLKLASQYRQTQQIKRVLFHPGFPVDIRHNAKIFREKIAVWAAGKLQ